MIKNLKGVIGIVFMFLCLFGIKQGTCLVYGEVEVRVYSPEERGYRFTDNIEGIDFDEENNVLTLENYKGEEIQIKNDGKGGNNNIIINVKGNNEIYAREQCIESSADNGGPKREIVKFGDAITGMPNTGYYTKIGWELWVEGVGVEFTGDGTLDFYCGDNNDIQKIHFLGCDAIINGPTINCYDLRNGFDICDSKFIIKSGELNIYNAPEIVVNRDKETEKILQSYFYYHSCFSMIRSELIVQGGNLNITYVYPKGEYGKVKLSNPGHDSTWFVNFENLVDSMDPIFEEGDGITYVFENPDLIYIYMPDNLRKIYGASDISVGGKTISIRDKEKGKVKEETKKIGKEDVNVDTKIVKKGSVIKDKKYKYKVIKQGSVDGKSIGEVSILGFKKKTYKKVNVASVITVDGIKYKVTKIAKNAFKNNRKIKKVIIGKNIISIGKRAFANCKELKLVNIKSKKIVRIGKKAFYKGKRTMVKFKLPKGRKKSYKKLLKIA